MAKKMNAKSIGKAVRPVLKSLRAKSLAAAAVLAIALAGLGTLAAYFGDGDKATNTVTIGGVNSEIVEEFDPPEKITPGVLFLKDISVVNNGPSTAYIRVKAVWTSSDMEDLCTVDPNTDDWVYNEEDGYWYYKYAVADGASTSLLFNRIEETVETTDDGGNTVTETVSGTIKVSPDATDDQISDFDILVYCEAIQTGDFATYGEAWAAYKANIEREITD